MTTDTMRRPATWVGCLACYNNGYLVGEWCDARKAVAVSEKVCPRTDHEERWVFDHEYFYGLLSGEFFPHAGQKAAEWFDVFLERFGDGIPTDIPVDVVLQWAGEFYGDNLLSNDADMVARGAEEHYVGCAETWTDLAEQLFGDDVEQLNLPNWLVVDYEAMGRTLDIEYSEYRTGDRPGVMFVFHHH